MKVRLDSYLWAIRIFKSRTLASNFVKSGKVKLKGVLLKPSHLVVVGEIFQMNMGNGEMKVIEVVKLIEKRLAYDLIKECYYDHSVPKENAVTASNSVFKINVQQEKGVGRPTKKNRRDLGKHGGWF